MYRATKIDATDLTDQYLLIISANIITLIYIIYLPNIGCAGPMHGMRSLSSVAFVSVNSVLEGVCRRSREKILDFTRMQSAPQL